ncbi:MAG: S41 family peptidase [Bacteroidetes bacterium]|nr:S41 family peptidase [Bacteroidota bacterium]MCL5026279.1 S41 family peptidase [Chloroflexota bacterium]
MKQLHKPRIRVLLALIAALILLGGGFVGGVSAERAGVLPGTLVFEPPDVASTFSIFWETWDLVQQHYVDRSAINPVQMTYGAIQGMLASLGDVGHTRFLSPQDLKSEQESLSGQLQGIGAELGVRNGRPTIVAPIPGSPAQKAGLRPGDTIVRVDGQDVSSLSLDQIVSLVRGKPGTSVTLTVIHRGETSLTNITIVRAEVKVPMVSWATLPGTTVAHVQVSEFGEHSTDQLVAAINAAHAAGATGLILDLRNNPGGLLQEAVGTASQFLRDGNVLLERDAQGHTRPFPVQSGGVALDDPLVVLVNEGSASSAEVVAGAIQDHKRAPLVGTITFGTGTVLTQYNLSDGSAVLLGTSEWLTPDGHQIWHHGIVPNIQVALPPDAVPLIPEEESSLTPEQLQASQDTQLLRALQELTQSTTPQ